MQGRIAHFGVNLTSKAVELSLPTHTIADFF